MITDELGVRTIGSVVHVHEYIISICLMSHGWSEKVCTFNQKCEMRDKLYCDSEWGVSMCGAILIIFPLREKLWITTKQREIQSSII